MVERHCRLASVKFIVCIPFWSVQFSILNIKKTKNSHSNLEIENQLKGGY